MVSVPRKVAVDILAHSIIALMRAEGRFKADSSTVAPLPIVRMKNEDRISQAYLIGNSRTNPAYIQWQRIALGKNLRKGRFIDGVKEGKTQGFNAYGKLRNDYTKTAKA